jgi:hypothetical protein
MFWIELTEYGHGKQKELGIHGHYEGGGFESPEAAIKEITSEGLEYSTAARCYRITTEHLHGGQAVVWGDEGGGE